MFFSLSPPPPCPSGTTVPVPCLPAPSAHRAPTLCLPGRAQAVPEGAGLEGAGAGPRASAEAAMAAAALGRGEGREPGLREEHAGTSEEEGKLSRKKLLQFPPYIPSCESLGRGLSAGLSSPSAFPPAADTSRKWESNRDSFSKTVLTSLPLLHVPPCLRLDSKTVCKKPMQIPHQKLCIASGRETGTPHAFIYKFNNLLSHPFIY